MGGLVEIGHHRLAGLDTAHGAVKGEIAVLHRLAGQLGVLYNGQGLAVLGGRGGVVERAKGPLVAPAGLLQPLGQLLV